MYTYELCIHMGKCGLFVYRNIMMTLAGGMKTDMRWKLMATVIIWVIYRDGEEWERMVDCITVWSWLLALVLTSDITYIVFAEFDLSVKYHCAILNFFFAIFLTFDQFRAFLFGRPVWVSWTSTCVPVYI